MHWNHGVSEPDWYSDPYSRLEKEPREMRCKDCDKRFPPDELVDNEYCPECLSDKVEPCENED